MKQNFLTRSLAVAIATMMTFTGCYDDSDLQTRMDQAEADIAELQQLVKDINTNISGLVTVVDALKNSDQITSVTPLSDGSGYTITFSKSGTITIYNGKNGVDGTNGTNGENGADGHTPQISVKLDSDGQYYWTVDGEYLTDAEGKKIPATAHIATPQIRINEGNFEISYNEGLTWEIIGNAGASDDVVFKQVIDGPASVLFVLSNGTQIEIPKTQQFVINVTSTDVIASPGQMAFVDFTVSGADENTVVDAFGTKGYEASVMMSNASTGSLTITVPDPMTDGKVYLMAVKSDGSTAARIFSCEEGVFSVDETAFAAKVPAAGGNIEVPVRTNVSGYMVMVDPGNQWIKHVETKAVKTETLVFSVEANTSTEERSGKVIIMPPMGMGMPANYVIVQEGMSDTPPVVSGGGSADLETINGGEVGRNNSETYTTANGWYSTGAVVNKLTATYYPDYQDAPYRPKLNANEYFLGTLTSPTLSGGCGTLTITWARASLNLGSQFVVEIQGTDGTVLKSETHVDTEAAQHVINVTPFEMNVAGDFVVVIRNQNYEANDSSTGSLVADTMFVIDVDWTGYSE
ncbi:MAG: hypothetical protein E7124_05235 [Bacteroidales bacterium]|nr:hypothetical protein [Bacteroidales bacterium]